MATLGDNEVLLTTNEEHLEQKVSKKQNTFKLEGKNFTDVNHSHSLVTEEEKGFMSKEDKYKLDNLPDNREEIENINNILNGIIPDLNKIYYGTE